MKALWWKQNSSFCYICWSHVWHYADVITADLHSHKVTWGGFITSSYFTGNTSVNLGNLHPSTSWRVEILGLPKALELGEWAKRPKQTPSPGDTHHKREADWPDAILSQLQIQGWGMPHSSHDSSTKKEHQVGLSQEGKTGFDKSREGDWPGQNRARSAYHQATENTAFDLTLWCLWPLPIVTTLWVHDDTMQGHKLHSTPVNYCIYSTFWGGCRAHILSASAALHVNDELHPITVHCKHLQSAMDVRYLSTDYHTYVNWVTLQTSLTWFILTPAPQATPNFITDFHSLKRELQEMPFHVLNRRLSCLTWGPPGAASTSAETCHF